jgi:hypothetical protein
MDYQEERIEAYLNDELEAGARADFERAMQSDDALRAAVERHQAVHDALDTLRLREQVRNNLRPPAPDGAGRFGRWWLPGIVFAGILAGAVYFWTARPPEPAPAQPQRQTPAAPTPPPKPPLKNPPPTPNPAAPRPLSPGARRAYAAALGQLENLDYTFMGAPQKDTTLERQINQAIALLKNEQPTRAIPLLEAARARENALYQEDIAWLLALAWLPENTTKGRTLLQAIADDPAHTKRLDALKILRQLE